MDHLQNGSDLVDIALPQGPALAFVVLPVPIKVCTARGQHIPSASW